MFNVVLSRAYFWDTMTYATNQHNMKENLDGTVEIHEIEPEVSLCVNAWEFPQLGVFQTLEILIRYIYTETLPSNFDEIRCIIFIVCV